MGPQRQHALGHDLALKLAWEPLGLTFLVAAFAAFALRGVLVMAFVLRLGLTFVVAAFALRGVLVIAFVLRLVLAHLALAFRGSKVPLPRRALRGCGGGLFL